MTKSSVTSKRSGSIEELENFSGSWYNLEYALLKCNLAERGTSDLAGEAKRFVVFFDANMPLPMRERLKPQMPYAELVYLNGDIHRNGQAGLHRVSDAAVLAITLERATRYPSLRPYLVTQDQAFAASAGYNPRLHPIGIFIIPGLTSAIFQRAIEERILHYFENELFRANPV